MKHTSPLTEMLLAGLLAAVSPATAQDAYRITDIGDLPGNFGSRGAAINESGVVVGFSFGSSGVESFIWDEVNDIRSLGSLAGAQSIWVQDINDAGVMAGYTDGGINQAFVQFDETSAIISLGVVGSDFASQGRAINNSNQIVGNSDSSAMIWDDDGSGIAYLVDTIGGTAILVGKDINDTGTVVGLSNNDEAFVFIPGQAAEELGRLDPADIQSDATAVNNSNQTVGSSRPDGLTARAWYWQPGGSMMDIGATDPSHDLIMPAAINDLGQVVGTSGSTFEADAFLWTATDGMQDLNQLIDPTDPLANTVVLQQALDINESGQIVADGSINFAPSTFLLTPVTIGSPPPATLISFSGDIIDVDDVTGTGTYASVGIGDSMSGTFAVGETDAGSLFVPPWTYQFPSSTFFGTITDGVVETSTFNSNRPLEIGLENDVATTADDIALINDILGTNLPPGTPIDVYQIETDVSGVGRRLEIGISYVSLDLDFITDTTYRTPPALNEVDLAVYFIVEEQGPAELYNAIGLIDAQTIGVPADSDGDGVADYLDNCTLVSNGPLTPNIGSNSQRDSNDDGYGNICDADLNNDGIVNPVDLGLFKSAFFTNDADADFNGDGIVNPIDLGLLKLSFFMPPGPSGIAP